jgi:hypothetical protein
MVRYGGDSGQTAFYRKGILHFYNNTVVIRADLNDAWRVKLFDLSTNDETVELENNIIYRKGSSNFFLMSNKGNANLIGMNWISQEWNEGGSVNISSDSLVESNEQCFVDMEGLNFTQDSNTACFEGDVKLGAF